jgi:multidrug efflux pump subunit AcrB
MVKNRVTPNLLMVFLLAGGLYMTTQITQEVFPDFEIDLVRITVGYRGASPEEVENGIVVAVESAIRSIEGVKEVHSTAAEGMAVIYAWLYTEADRQKAHQDIKQAVDRITTLPKNAERPEVSLIARRREVLRIQLYGDVSERILRELAEQVRDRMLQHPNITQVDLLGAREYRILVEIPQQTLRRHGLTLEEVARRLGAASVELPGGKIETKGGQILLRVKDRRQWARGYARIPVITTPEGTVLRLSDIAEVIEGFEDTNHFALYNGKRSIGVGIFRVGEQTPGGVVRAARQVMAEVEKDLPPGVKWAVGRDRSEIYQQRLHLLLKNAFIGLVLVLIVLGLFLELRLAFWVTMGIPTSFLGGLLFLGDLGVSINMISMFAFIVALGIVVDDAIVAGENIYEYRNRGMGFVEAAIRGTRDVAIPISFSILTNIVAFLPLYFMEGHIGKIWKVIPLVVVTVFVISWVEALFILPAHLAHLRRKNQHRRPGLFLRFQRAVARGLQFFIRRIYGPFLAGCIRFRFLTLAAGAAVLICTLAFVSSGRVGVILMPRVESDVAVATAVLPYGSPRETVKKVGRRLARALAEVKKQNGGDRLVEGVFTVVEENQVEVMAMLTDPHIRPISTRKVTALWRRAVGPIVGLQYLRFESDRGGPGSGAALTVELSHRDMEMLDRASEALAARLAELNHVTDIDDGYTPGKEQLNFKLKPAGQSLGLTSQMIGQQVRSAFYGAEAKRQQRRRSELRVLVRYPEHQRRSEYFIENLLITTPAGKRVPLREVAEVERGRAYTVIERRDGRRTVSVTANVVPIGKTSGIIRELKKTVLPELTQDYPGLAYDFRGRRQHMREGLSSLWRGFAIALLTIFFLLAIPFRSYAQPFIVMMAIPFGVVGAVFGHLIMGYNLSVMSMMGIVALAGVVVNDSLVLIDYANRLTQSGVSPRRAIHDAGTRRFRPIILTTLTTFGGLTPMILETSRQARFMIPMALSLGFGILFATVITLVLVPCLYLVIADISGFFGGIFRRIQPETAPASSNTATAANSANPSFDATKSTAVSSPASLSVTPQNSSKKQS